MKDIEEICRKLKPVIGDKQAEKLWQTYLLSDGKWKKWAEHRIRITAAKHLGSALDDSISLLPPPKEMSKARFPIGTVLYRGKEQWEFDLNDRDLLGHVAVYGTTGAGKTNVAFALLGALYLREVPFLIFDWKRNYRDLLASEMKDKIDVFSIGRDIAPFFFNPLIPPPGITPKAYLKKLIEIISSALYCGEGVKYILMKAIDSVYREAGMYSQSFTKKYPTMNDVYTYLVEYKAKGREAQWMISSLRAVRSLCFGGIGKVINGSSITSVGEILKKNCILELDALSETDKVFFIDCLLLYIHHYRMDEEDREKLKSVILIEEAHHILKKEQGTGAEKIIETLFREIRELGTGLVLIDQMPSLISPVALANSNTTICLCLNSKADIAAVSSSLLLEEKEWLGELETGQAIMKARNRYGKAFHIGFRHMKAKKGAIRDEDLRNHMASRGYSTDTIDSTASLTDSRLSKPIPLADRIDGNDELLLNDIAKYELCGMVARYKRIGLSRRKGNDAKKKLIEEKLVKAEEVQMNNIRTVLLELTDVGRRFLKSVKKKNESLEHKYFKRKIAERYRNEGYRVIEEEDDKGQGPDLVVVKGDKTAAVEIETGKSDIRANIKRNKGFDEVIIVPTSEKARKKVEKVIGDSDVEVVVLLREQ